MISELFLFEPGEVLSAGNDRCRKGSALFRRRKLGKREAIVGVERGRRRLLLLPLDGSCASSIGARRFSTVAPNVVELAGGEPREFGREES